MEKDTMSDSEINQIVGRLAGGGPESARLQELLSTTFKQTDENPYWIFHEFELNDSPLPGGEFRRSKEGDKGLLSLRAREEPAIKEADLDLNQLGEVVNIRANPRIPPEGADTYVYNVEGVQVSFQFAHTSRRLLSVTLEWGAA
jgi:hypothetical protein